MADTEIVLLPEEDGRVGKVAVTGAQGSVLLERAFDGTSVATGANPLAPQVQPVASIAERFAALLAFQQQSGFGDPGDLKQMFRLAPDRNTDDRGGQVPEIGNVARGTIPEQETVEESTPAKRAELDDDDDDAEEVEEEIAEETGEPAEENPPPATAGQGARR